MKYFRFSGETDVRAKATTINGAQLIHCAAHSGHLAMVQWLHEQGVPLTPTDGIGLQPTHYAVAGGHLAVVQWLNDQGEE